jgi:hypothetical protein
MLNFRHFTSFCNEIYTVLSIAFRGSTVEETGAVAGGGEEGGAGTGSKGWAFLFPTERKPRERENQREIDPGISNRRGECKENAASINAASFLPDEWHQVGYCCCEYFRVSTECQ